MANENPKHYVTPNFQIWRVKLLILISTLCLVGLWLRISGNGLACPNFPHCVEMFWPLPFSIPVAIAFLHRWAGVAIAGYAFHFGVTLLKTSTDPKKDPLAKKCKALCALSATQIVLGIGTIMSSLSPRTRAMHAVTGYLILVILIMIKNLGDGRDKNI